MTGPQLVYDNSPRPLPASLETEQALLGAILVNNEAYKLVAPTLDHVHFSDTFHGEIYRALGYIIERGKEASPSMMAPYVGASFQDTDMSVETYLQRVAGSAFSVVNIKDYADTIVDLYQRREVILELQDALTEAYAPELDKTASEISASAVAALSAVGKAGATVFKTARQIRLDFVEQMKHPIPRSSTGYTRLDASMGGGMYAGKLYLLAARKKAGKTVISNAIARNASGPGSDVLFIAAEMGSTGIEQRRWAAEMGINSLRFLNNDPGSDPKFVADAAAHAIDTTENLHYVHAPGVYLDKLRRLLTQFFLSYPDAKGFVLDYFQLVRGADRGESQVSHGDRVAQWLADFCVERNVWGLVLAQQNQEGNIRFGEGIRMSCDMAFEMKRTQDGAGSEAYFNMIETRYTPWRNVGDEHAPALRLNKSVGPVFDEIDLHPADDEKTEQHEMLPEVVPPR